MEKFLYYGLIGGSISLLMLYLNKASGRTIEAVEGVYQLRIHKLYQFIGIVSSVIGSVLLVLPLIYDGLAALPVALGMFLLFTGLGVPCILWYRNHHLIYNPEKISSKSWLGKSSEIYWKDIKNISFNSLSGLLLIEDARGTKVKAHQHLVGLKSFVEFMEQKTNMTARELKLPFSAK